MFNAPDYMQLLPPSVLARFANAGILVRGFVEGFKHGEHKSLYVGTSTEFAEHREYSPGDDPRDLDWRVYGKMDRYYVKQYVEETNVRATILLDASGSMAYTGDAAQKRGYQRLSKFAFAQHLAAVAAYLLTRQGDAAGIATFDTKLRSRLPAASTPAHLQRMLQLIHATSPGGESSLADVLHDIAERIPRRGLVFLVSDFFDDVPELIRAFHHLRFRKHQLVIFHVLAEEERTFPFGSSTRFRNLEEMADQLNVDPRTIRGEYLKQFNAFLEELEAGCGQVQADYVRFETNKPFEETLTNYLSSRARR